MKILIFISTQLYLENLHANLKDMSFLFVEIMSRGKKFCNMCAIHFPIVFCVCNIWNLQMFASKYIKADIFRTIELR